MTQTTTDTRLVQLQDWLLPYVGTYQLDLASLQPASSDASFRRYFRLKAGTQTLIVMDAPPDSENCQPFIHVTQLLQQAQVHTPTILEQNTNLGFLLLSDLGKKTYFDRLHEQPSATETHQRYVAALNSLIQVQQSATTGLAQYDHAHLRTELSLFPDWYVKRHHQTTLDSGTQTALALCFEQLINFNLSQANCLVLRDFHSPNIMINENDILCPGIIDYQDAVIGPITYDLASLLYDARFTWFEEQQLDWAIRYWEHAKKQNLPIPADFAEFHQAYEWMGLQRNLRILGVFARLNIRDGKAGYLQHIPRVNAYVRQVAERYQTFKPLIKLLDQLDQLESGFTF